MEYVREVKKSFCILSVAYLVIGIVLLIWPDISVRTFCYVFGIAMIIFGGAYLIMYFTKDRLQSVMESDLVIGVVAAATGFFILIKMEYMLEIIPFALGILALLGAIVKIQNGVDLKRLRSKRWFIMILWAVVLLVFGAILIVNPFEEQQKIVVILVGTSLLVDGLGNLTGIFWIGYSLKTLKRVQSEENEVDACKKRKNAYNAEDIVKDTEKIDVITEEDDKELPMVYTDEMQDEE